MNAATQAFLLACILATGCTTRDAANPLDPDNPDTRGGPDWLTALADDGAVDLSWSVPAYDDLAEVRLVDALAESVLARGGAGEGSFRHRGLANGVERRYRLDLLLDRGRALELPADAAEPGPEVVWVFEDGSGSVTRLTPDGRARRLRVSARDGNSVFADADSGLALVTEFYAGRVRLLDRDGVERWRNEAFLGPLAALRAPGGWWVGDSRSGAVHFLDEAGAIVESDTSLALIVDLAPAPEGGVWVADRTGTVARIARGHGVVRRDTLAVEPIALCAAADGGYWVADRASAAILRVTAGGAVAVRLEQLPGIVGLTPDPLLSGAVWAVDRARRRVALFDAEGTPRGEIGRLSSPAAVVVSPDGQVLWVADPGLGRVLRLRRDGVELGRSVSLAYPTTVAIAFAPARPAS